MSSVASLLSGTPAGLATLTSATIGTINLPNEAQGLNILNPHDDGSVKLTLSNQAGTPVSGAYYTLFNQGSDGPGLTAGSLALYQYTPSNICPIFNVPYAPVGGYGGNPSDNVLITNVGLLDAARTGTVLTDGAGAGVSPAVLSINNNSTVILFPIAGPAFPAAAPGPVTKVNVGTLTAGFTFTGAANTTYRYLVLG